MGREEVHGTKVSVRKAVYDSKLVIGLIYIQIGGGSMHTKERLEEYLLIHYIISMGRGLLRG